MLAQIAINAIQRDIVCDYYSLEDTTHNLQLRFIAQKGRLNLESMVHGRWNMADWQKIRDSCGPLYNHGANLLICEELPPSLDRLAFTIYANAMKRKTRLIVIDYLQLATGATGNGRESTNDRVSACMRTFKRIAKTTGAAVVIASQLSRKGDEGAPQLSHLRDSGAIEQDAHVVLMLQAIENENVRLVHVRKNKDGRTGLTILGWAGESVLFFDLEKSTRDEVARSLNAKPHKPRKTRLDNMSEGWG